MFHMKYYLFYLIGIHLIVCTPQLNLYSTNGVSENNDAIQHNCLRTVITEDLESNYHEIMSYCMSEFPSKFHIEKDDFISYWTFFELSQLNITSNDLYLWSAPIDIIENYQFYLQNKIDLSLSKEIYYNCTMPRFGPQCQYELLYYYSLDLSLYEIIYNFYRLDVFSQTTLTCYTHLKCNDNVCLDWSEICDGEINCFNDGIDEKYCFELEINECSSNEYRCKNGECIPKSFYKDNFIFADCIDQSDLESSYIISREYCQLNRQHLFKCDDIPCQIDSPLNFCLDNRVNLMIKAMNSTENNFISSKCWSAFKCLLEFLTCENVCEDDECIMNVNEYCPNMIYFPSIPLLFGNVYLAFKKSDLQYGFDFDTTIRYICYKTFYYDEIFRNKSKIFFNNLTCVNYKPFTSGMIPWDISIEESLIWGVSSLYKLFGQYDQILNYTSMLCNRSSMYQCMNSLKCISIYRLMDRRYDCPYRDDENIVDRFEHLEKTHFKCEQTGKYIHQYSIEDNKCDCGYNDDGRCDDESMAINYLRKTILFQHICDGFIDQIPIIINGINQTDETECSQWECINIYTRCNQIWNCPNGKDESGCGKNNCSSHEHLCVSPNTNQFICISIDKINDGNIDCLGSTDEIIHHTNIQLMSSKHIYATDFCCRNGKCVGHLSLCDGQNDCQYGDDEQFCTQIFSDDGICPMIRLNISKVERFLCEYRLPRRHWEVIYFQLGEMINQDKNIKNNIIALNSPQIEMSNERLPRCHRGLDLIVWLKNNLTSETCLCPLHYYGSQCQYQNQRISLSIQFRALSNSLKIPFAIIISLIDDTGIIHSYEQITYLSLRHCQMKYNLYLVYSIRPKNSSRIYSIRIDIYEKISLNHRGSLVFEIKFPFLPVHRIGLIVDIPRSNDKNQICSNSECIHGRCMRYSNMNNLTYCQCYSGWSGRYCTIPYRCQCSSDSLCIGISMDNRSICVCSLNRFGSRCLIHDSICDKLKCENNGQCISNIDRNDFICICLPGFSGHRCEIIDTKVVLSFEKDVLISEHIYVHFIDIISMKIPVEYVGRATTFRRIRLKEDSIIIYWSERFHLIFTEVFNKIYYLTYVRNIWNQSRTITVRINSLSRCPHISELLNRTIVNLHLIRRIKYYHLPCRNQTLNCFYDEFHLCLCYEFEQKRLSNCFKFDHNISFDCLGRSECENGGRCLENRLNCPTSSLCICPPCFYGSRCQFRTSGFGLSLDGILGYNILPNVSLSEQTIIIKMSLSLTIMFVLMGIVNGIVSCLTFKNKRLREVGCGIYLLSSSISTLFLLIIFALKFFILLFSQMGILTNRLFLEIQCYSMDFLLQVCLCFDQWLSACVTIERVITTMKGAVFVNKNSKQIAKFVIITLLIVVIATWIHDPIYRNLIDEENDGDYEKRTWCVASYSFNLQIYNSLINIFHFFGPFILNFISVILLISNESHQQLNPNSDRIYRKFLFEQFRTHKDLLTGPIVLVLLAFPHLIITFVSKCMKSADDAWLFVIAYFIPFIPPMITFIIFIVPSKIYMKVFRKTLTEYLINIQRRFY